MLQDLVRNLGSGSGSGKDKVDLKKIRNLEFFVLGNKPVLTAIHSVPDDKTERIFFDSDLNIYHKVVYDVNGSDFTVIDHDKQPILAAQEWNGKKKEIPQGDYISTIYHDGKSIGLFNESSKKIKSLKYPFFIDGFDLRTLSLNNKDYISLSGFSHDTIFNPDKGIILVIPLGEDNHESQGNCNIVSLKKNSEDFLFGYAAKNQEEISEDICSHFLPKSAKQGNKALVSLDSILVPRIVSDFYSPNPMKGKFMLFDRDFNGEIISRKRLGLRKDSFIAKVESHMLDGKQYVMIGESIEKTSFRKDSFLKKYPYRILHIYDSSLNKVHEIRDIVLLDDYLLGLQANTKEGSIFAYLDPNRIMERDGKKTLALKVLDGSFKEKGEVPQCSYSFRKLLIKFGGEEYILSSPFFRTIELSDIHCNHKFSLHPGAKDTKEFLSGDFIDSFDVVSHKGRDYFCMDMQGSHNLRVLDDKFNQVSEISLFGNHYTGISLSTPINPYNFSLIPFLKYHAYKEKRALGPGFSLKQD